MGDFLLDSVTTNFFSANLNFKNLDEECLFSHLLSQVPSLSQKTIILRR